MKIRYKLITYDSTYDIDSGSGNDNNKKNNNGSSERLDLEIIDSIFYPDNSIKQVRIGFIAEVPAFGYRSFEIIPENVKPVQTSTSHETHSRIVNLMFKLTQRMLLSP